MTDRARTTADLHCHSAASGPNGNWWYSHLEIADCKTPPAEVYAQAKAAGMDFVALTDHDTIEGALELAHHPDFIVGEEVTVHFPEDGWRIDVVVLGLDADQHRQIQSRRDDAYTLVRYLREQRLAHFLAHPIYDPANALASEHLVRLGGLFTLWETRNGARLPEANELAERLHPDLERHRRLAAELGIEPSPTPPGAIGGSDDHGGTDVGTTYTVTPAARTAEEYLDHLRAGRCRAAGLHADPARMTHMMLRLLDRHRTGDVDERRAEAWRALAGGTLKHRQLARLAEALAVEESDDDELQLPFADPNGLGAELSTLRRYARGQLQLIPYLVVQAYLARERRGARALARRAGADAAPRAVRVALLADGLTSVNGIAATYRELLPHLDGSRASVVPIACGASSELAGASVACAARLRLPLYPDLDLPLPHLSELGERLFDLDADLIHVTGPGPLGLAGLAAAKLLRLPLVASYHTELGDYAVALTDDPLIGELAHAGTARFYRAADLVLAPSELTARRLPDLLGVDAAKVAVVGQAVDGERFSPVHRDLSSRARADLPLVLCVARLSREKGLDRFVDAARPLAGKATFVLVGDGPARADLESASGGAILFTGWLHGDDLARAFASADLFVLPSGTETCGQVLLEAQASGLPCVVSPAGAARETIRPNVTGMVAASDRPEAYAAAIETLLDDAPRRASMAAAARRHALSRSWQEAAAALEAVYLRLAAEPASLEPAGTLTALG